MIAHLKILNIRCKRSCFVGKFFFDRIKKHANFGNIICTSRSMLRKGMGVFQPIFSLAQNAYEDYTCPEFDRKLSRDHVDKFNVVSILKVKDCSIAKKHRFLNDKEISVLFKYLLKNGEIYMVEFTVEVLVATMNQENTLLPEKMNIQSNAIIGNQCDRNTVETIQYREHLIKYLNFNERGVGLNRNNALMRATGDIVLFADDDMRYVDDYPEKVKLAFANHPDADVIIFNLIEKNPRRYIIQKDFKVRWYNFLRFGTARIAAKRKVIHHKGISFNICFGGGTEHANGEDNIFLASCLREGLKIYAVPVAIAELTEERASTWFEGYTKKYFMDKGILYSVIAPRMYPFLCMQDAFRHKYEGYTKIDVIRLMLRGEGKQTWRE